MLGKGPTWGLFTQIYDWQQNTSHVKTLYFLHLFLALIS